MAAIHARQIESVQALSAADLDRVADIHCAAFPNSVLTRIGKRAVRRYYRWLLLGPHDAVALGVRRGGELAGFSFAGVFRNALSGFLQHNCFALVWSVLSHPSVLAHPNNRRRLVAGARAMIPFLRCEAKSPALWPAAESFGVLVLAMDPTYKRSGYGRLLMEACGRIAADRRFPVMRLTVNPKNEPAIHFYERLGWSKLTVNGQWHGVMFKPVAQPANPAD